jgi:hypothetical protein
MVPILTLADEPGVFREPARIQIKGIPKRLAIARTASRLRIETGWPPPELSVTVTMINGMRSAFPVARAWFGARAQRF